MKEEEYSEEQPEQQLEEQPEEQGDLYEDDMYLNETELNTNRTENIGGIYELFKRVMENEEVTRIANLSKAELGDLKFSVRGSLYVAHLADSFGHKKFGDFFINQAKIIMETSLSKEGYLVSTFVTSKRYATRDTNQNQIPIEAELNKKKRMLGGMFNKK